MPYIADFTQQLALDLQGPQNLDLLFINPELIKYKPTVLVLPQSPRLNPLRNRVITPQGGVAIRGSGFDFDGTDDYLDLGNIAVANHSAHTVVCISLLRSFTVPYPVLFNYLTTGGGGRRKIFYSDQFGYSDIEIGSHGQFGGGFDDVANFNIAAVTSVTNSWHRFVFRFAGTTNTSLSAWCNGRELTRSGGAGTNTQTGDNCIGRSSTNDASNHFSGIVKFLLVFDSILPEALCREISAAPYSCFSPLGIFHFFSVGGGGTEYTITPSGSIVFSGAVPLLKTRTQIPSGSFTLSGTVPLRKERIQIPSGSFTLSGTVPFRKERIQVPSGSVIFSGTAPFSANALYTINPTGGITFSGNPAQIHTKVQVPSGAVNFTGGSSISFIPVGGVLNVNEMRISTGISRKIRTS